MSTKNSKKPPDYVSRPKKPLPHFSSDVWSSLTVLAGLAFVALGFPSVDSIAAIVVAFLVLFVSYRLGRRTVDALMDRVPGGLAEKIEGAIKEVDGVEEVRSVRLRVSGSKIFVDTTIAIRRTTPFEQAHRIMDDVEKAVKNLEPNADLVVHAEPFIGRDETIVDKVRMIVLNKGLRAPHNLEVHHSGGKYYIDFDVEYQRGNSFEEAHKLASEIEDQIQGEVPSVEKVTIHMEEFVADEMEFVDATAVEHELCGSIRAMVTRDKRVAECTDLRVLKQGSRYHISLTCKIDKSKTLEEVHRIISELETELYRRFKQLRRLTIHAEPT